MTVVIASVLILPAAERRPLRPVSTAFYANQELQIQPVTNGGTETFTYGPWAFGSLVADDKASDHRFNLYLIVPGTEHQSPAPADEFNHTLLINAVEGQPDHPAEWDVFWAVVLDPSWNREIHEERELILQGQSYFLPGDLYDVEDAPGRNILRQLGVTSLNDMTRFRRADGELPRVLLLSAGAAVRMNVTPPPPPE